MNLGHLDPSNAKAITCEKVSKRFGFYFALKNVSFEVEPNSIFGILGPNGAGKTTLIKMLAGLSKPSNGTISIAGLDYEKDPSAIRRMLGVIIDQSFLYNELTIVENLKFYAHLFSRYEESQIRLDIERYLKLFNLDEWIDEPVRILSTGMRRKVELVRALIHNPRFILIDELFLGLDVKTIELLVHLIRDLREKENVSFVLSTHNINLALELCDEIIVLKRGKINKSAKKDEFKQLDIESYF